MDLERNMASVGEIYTNTYGACLERGRLFHYDLDNMRIGKPMSMSATSQVTHLQTPR
jgi:hypothetical protein